MSEALRDRLILCIPIIISVAVGLIVAQLHGPFSPFLFWDYVIPYVPGGIITGVLLNVPPFQPAIHREFQRVHERYKAAYSRRKKR